MLWVTEGFGVASAIDRVDVEAECELASAGDLREQWFVATDAGLRLVGGWPVGLVPRTGAEW